MVPDGQTIILRTPTLAGADVQSVVRELEAMGYTVQVMCGDLEVKYVDRIPDIKIPAMPKVPDTRPYWRRFERKRWSR